MSITQLKIDNFRNLDHIELQCNPRFNLIYGLNGAGKSNLLEAIYFLGCGKSFRTHLLRRLLTYKHDTLQLFAQILTQQQRSINIGIKRSITTDNELRMGGESIKSHSEIAYFLPMQIISQASYEILESGSQIRRRFLDWGVFHVEHNFMQQWQNLNRVIKQRNTAIRNQLARDQITLWDQELIASSLAITKWRQEYFVQLTPIIHETLAKFLPQYSFAVDFEPGWSQKHDLATILRNELEQDINYGYTRFGAHRADIKIRNTQNRSISTTHTLSRGQQKLLVIALKLGQGRLLRELTNKSCIFLIDDLPAELDHTKKSLVFELLQELAAQIFISSVEAENFNFLKSIITADQMHMFHVEHGEISQK